MRAPPDPARFVEFPITVGVGALAIAVTGLWHADRIDVARWAMTDAWPSEPWRLLSATLPHVGLVHLAFNLYWLWIFGTIVEGELDSPAFAGIVALIAAGSSAAEFALFRGGVGLSGVGYGLFGLLYVLSRRDRRFHDAMDERVERLFVGWFFLCIALTVTEVMPVANVAHGVGALLGLLVGLVMTEEGERRARPAAAIAGVLALAGLGASVGRARVNLAGTVAGDRAREGILAYRAERWGDTARLLAAAIDAGDRSGQTAALLGYARMRIEDRDGALAAGEAAVAREPGNLEYRKALARMRVYFAREAHAARDFSAAAKLYAEALEVDAGDAATWRDLAVCWAALGDEARAEVAAARARALIEAGRREPPP